MSDPAPSKPLTREQRREANRAAHAARQQAWMGTSEPRDGGGGITPRSLPPEVLARARAQVVGVGRRARRHAHREAAEVTLLAILDAESGAGVRERLAAASECARIAGLAREHQHVTVEHRVSFRGLRRTAILGAAAGAGLPTHSDARHPGVTEGGGAASAVPAAALALALEPEAGAGAGAAAPDSAGPAHPAADPRDAIEARVVAAAALPPRAAVAQLPAAPPAPLRGM